MCKTDNKISGFGAEQEMKFVMGKERKTVKRKKKLGLDIFPIQFFN